MKVVVSIRRKEGLADPEGLTTARALTDLGYEDVSEVHFGRTIVLEIEIDNAVAAHAQVSEMCERLLSNPVIEDYTIEVGE